MICTNCKSDNKDDAVFCEQCGAPLNASTEEKKEDVVDEVTISLDDVAQKAEEAADPEDQTTVLISNAALDEIKEAAKDKAPEQKAPAFTAPAPAPMPPMNNAPMGQPMNKAPMGQPMNGAPMGQPMNGAPMGQPMNGAPMGQPMNKAPMGKPEKAPKPPKAPKAPKAPKEPGAMKTGVKVYIVISIILLAGLIGTGIWGFLHFTNKVDDLEKDNSKLTIDLDDAKSEIDGLNSDIDDKNDTIDALNSEISSLNDTCDSYETQIADLQESAGEYAAYDSLISFAKSATGQGYADFFVSDTVVHLTGGETAVKLYFANEGDVMYTCNDSSVVSCEWSDNFENNVASLYLTPTGSGNTQVTITNSVNDEEITIYVFVD
ncbi:MAG: hypothetical protein PUB54_07800 [Lachnospiraceae bacterium]|nr:hypothetical protein [Lachnospiraceae bacterium]